LLARFIRYEIVRFTWLFWCALAAQVLQKLIIVNDLLVSSVRRISAEVLLTRPCWKAFPQDGPVPGSQLGAKTSIPAGTAQRISAS
jgi:hypothetical protein